MCSVCGYHSYITITTKPWVLASSPGALFLVTILKVTEAGWEQGYMSSKSNNISSDFIN